MNNLVDKLIEGGWLKTPHIIEAFQKVRREDFMPARIATQSVAGESEDLRALAELNEALPIGYAQTISQPLVVAFMLEKLQPQLGEKILDIGSGSGWTTALLSHIVGQKGKVIAVEIIYQLKEFGQQNAGKYSFVEKGIAQFIFGDGNEGYPSEAPYDKILCSAEARELPVAWKKQLKTGGKIVIPMHNSIYLFDKISDNEFKEEVYPGFVFVPLVKE